MYIYYQQSYEAREERKKRSRQARAKRIIQRASRSRRQRRRRRAYVSSALQRMMPGSGHYTDIGGLGDVVSETSATRPGAWSPGASSSGTRSRLAAASATA